jgi:hypothetical protein
MDLLMKEDARNYSDGFRVQEGTKAFVLREITRHGGAEPPHIFAARVSADISNLVAKSRASGKANQVVRSWVRHFINGWSWSWNLQKRENQRRNNWVSTTAETPETRLR